MNILKEMVNNLLVTASNSRYFDSLLTLISSIHKTSFDLVDKILVYDLGLSTNEIEKLHTLKNVEIKKFTDIEKTNYPLLNDIKSYFFKIYILNQYYDSNINLFWLDSGACALRSIDSIFKIIDNEEIFLVGDYHLNKNYTHKKCQEIMNANDEEMNDTQLSAGIIGFKTHGKFRHFFEESLKFAKISECICGVENNHRQDQSILSILASRYNCNRQDIDIFGYWTDINRNLTSAIKNESVIFVHRRGYHNIDNLIYND